MMCVMHGTMLRQHCTHRGPCTLRTLFHAPDRRVRCGRLTVAIPRNAQECGFAGALLALRDYTAARAIHVPAVPAGSLSSLLEALPSSLLTHVAHSFPAATAAQAASALSRRGAAPALAPPPAASTPDLSPGGTSGSFVSRDGRLNCAHSWDTAARYAAPHLFPQPHCSSPPAIVNI